MTTRKPTRLSPPSKTAAAIAFERTALGMRRPWWTTVAASVLLVAGMQRQVDAAHTISNRTEVWDADSGGGTGIGPITISQGGHIRLVKPLPAPPAQPPVFLLGNEDIVLLNGAQLSGVDESVLPPPITPYAPAIGGNVIIGAAGNPGAVSVTLGQKGDTQALELGSALKPLVLKQDAAINAASDVRVVFSNGVPPSPHRTVSVGGIGSLIVQSSSGDDRLDFEVKGGHLNLSSNTSAFTGKTVAGSGDVAVTVHSGKLTADGAGANTLGAGVNKLVLLGGELDTVGATLQNAVIVATDSTHAVVKLAGSSDLGGTVTLRAGGASFRVDAPDSATLSGDVIGTGSLQKLGAGALVLSGANSYAGHTYLTEGEVRISAANNLSSAATSKVVFQGGALNVTATESLDPTAKFAPAAKGEHIKIKTAGQVTFTSLIPESQGGLRLVQPDQGSGATGLDLFAGANKYYGSTVLDGVAAPGDISTLTVDKLDDIATSSNIVIGAGAILDAAAGGNNSTFRPNQPIHVQNGGVLKVQVAPGVAKDANITVQLEDLRTAGSRPVQLTNPPLVSDLTLKVRVAPEARGATGLDTLLVGEKRVVVARRLTVGDYADGVVPVPPAPPTAPSQLVFLNPVFKVNNEAVTGAEVTRVDYAEFGAGSNGRALGHYFSQHLTGTAAPDVNFGKLHEAMDNAEYAPAITDMLRQLSPGAYGELARLQLRRAMAITDAIDDRIDSLTVRNMEAPKVSMGVQSQTASSIGTAPTGNHESESKWSAWASTYANSARMGASADSGLGSVRERSMGSTFGVEHHSGSAVVGLFGATAWGKSQFQDPSVNVSNDSWHIGLYTVAPIGNVTWEGSVIYGLTSNDSQRSVNLPGLPLGWTGGDYRAKFDSRDLLISTGVAINLTEPESAFQTAPVLRLSYANTQQGAVNETPQNSATGAYAANVDSVSNSSFLSKLGWKFSYATGGKDVAFRADASSYWQHDWSGGATTTNARLAGGPGINFPVSSRGSNTDSVLLNAGLQLMFSERYTTRVSINQELGGLSNETIGRATVGVNF